MQFCSSLYAEKKQPLYTHTCKHIQQSIHTYIYTDAFISNLFVGIARTNRCIFNHVRFPQLADSLFKQNITEYYACIHACMHISYCNPTNVCKYISLYVKATPGRFASRAPNFHLQSGRRFNFLEIHSPLPFYEQSNNPLWYNCLQHHDCLKLRNTRARRR